MKKFFHYGTEIIFQCDKSFESSLKREGIAYTALPYLEDIVFRYTADGIKKYAYVVPASMDEEYTEHVFLTTEIPEDLSWKNIAIDFRQQQRGETPMELPTRAYTIYREARRLVLARTPWTFELNPKPDTREMTYTFINLGTTIQELKEMDHNDCLELDEDF